MTGLPEKTHVSCKIGRADKQAIHAIDGSDPVKSVQTSATFDLEDQADFAIRRFQIITNAAEAGGAAESGANAAVAMRWIPHRPDQTLGFLDGFHHRDHDRLGTGVEDLLDHPCLAHRQAHDRVTLRAFECLYLRCE